MAIDGRTIAAVLLASAVLHGKATTQLSESEPQQQVKEMSRIRMVVEGDAITVNLDDNATAKDLVSLLPITLVLEDYNNTEKVSDLPRRLSTDGAPEGYDPSIGDITYYAPWGNLALFYRDFGYARGLVKLGRIESGLEVFNRPGTISVTFEEIQ